MRKKLLSYSYDFMNNYMLDIISCPVVSIGFYYKRDWIKKDHLLSY